MPYFSVVCFMLIIPWLLRLKVINYSQPMTAFWYVLLYMRNWVETTWTHFSWDFWTTIKNGFVLDFIGLRNENAIMSRTTHQSNLLPRSAISSFHTWSYFSICKILSVSLHISPIFSKWWTHIHAQFLDIAEFLF